MDNYVRSLNARLSKPVVLVAPVGQAVVMLRKKIIAHEIPEIPTQAAYLPTSWGTPSRRSKS